MKTETMARMKVTSSAFRPEGMIPTRHTCEGEDVSPELRIEGVPEAAKSLALIMDDPDAPNGTFVHWVVWNIDPTDTIPENNVPGEQGLNDFKKVDYGGPCPPSGTHRYFFKIYALDRVLSLTPRSTKKDIEKAMDGHILAQGELMGTYRKGVD